VRYRTRITNLQYKTAHKLRAFGLIFGYFEQTSRSTIDDRPCSRDIDPKRETNKRGRPEEFSQRPKNLPPNISEGLPPEPLAHLFDLRFHLLGDIVRQGRVRQSGCHFLSVIHHPVEEIGDDLASRCVF